MLRFIARRLAAGVALVAVLSAVTFLLLYVSGGNVARRVVGNSASLEVVQRKKHELGLDQPLLSRLGSWFSHAVRGDLGSSWFTGQPVTDAITTRLEVTLSLIIGATVLTAVLSVVFGALAAARGGWIDRAVQFVSVLGAAVPGFLVAVGLVLVFAIKLKLFAPTGYVNVSDSPTGWLSSITLPVIALSLGGVASVAAQVRGSMLDALRQDYVRTLRSRGLPEWRVVYLHVLRNAAGPALSMLALQFVALISGTVLVEQIFAIPGLGQLAVSATSQADIPLVMGLVVTVTVLVVLLFLVVDLLQGWLNPKARL